MINTGQRGDPRDHTDIRIDDFVEGVTASGAPYSGHVVEIDRMPWDVCVWVHEVGVDGYTKRGHWASTEPWRRVDLDREWGVFAASGLLLQRGFADAATAGAATTKWAAWGYTPEVEELCPLHRDVPRSICQRPDHATA